MSETPERWAMRLLAKNAALRNAIDAASILAGPPPRGGRSATAEMFAPQAAVGRVQYEGEKVSMRYPRAAFGPGMISPPTITADELTAVIRTALVDLKYGSDGIAREICRKLGGRTLPTL